jgi:hypothetical protein
MMTRKPVQAQDDEKDKGEEEEPILHARHANPGRAKFASGLDCTVGGNRTPNLRIWNPLLYQLSYDRKFCRWYHIHRKLERLRESTRPIVVRSMKSPRPSELQKAEKSKVPRTEGVFGNQEASVRMHQSRTQVSEVRGRQKVVSRKYSSIDKLGWSGNCKF